MNRPAWIAFAAVSVLWGFPYLLIKIAVDGGVPPLPLAWARLTLAAAILLAIAWRAGTLPPLRGRGQALLAYAVFELVIPFPMLAFGEQHAPSSTAAIVIATAPLLVVLLALRFEPGDRVDRRRLLGLMVGVVGVAALVGLDVSGESGELLGVGAFFLAAVGYAIGPMVLKRELADLDPIASMGACLAISALVLTPFAALTWPDSTPSDGALASIVALGIFCTGLALVLMAILVREAGPSRALVVTYVNPVIAVALGVIFLSEQPGPGALVGLALILAGSWLATGGRLPLKRGPMRPNRIQS